MKKIQFLLAAILLLTSPVVLADKPDPEVSNPPLNTMEANRDAVYDAIRVHEVGTAAVEVQGTADVNVTGGSIDANVTGGSIDANISGGAVTVDNANTNPVPVEGTVTVDNFPDQQGAWVDGGYLSPVTKAFYDEWVVIASETQGPEYFVVGPIQATTIYVSDWDNETRVFFL